VKSVILLEMAILAGGGIMGAYRADPNWQSVLLHDSTRVLIAVLILTVLLLTAEEVGFGQAAALFGGLTALSYLMGAAGWLGPQVLALERQLYNISPPNPGVPGRPPVTN
jgi:hypothetical protein